MYTLKYNEPTNNGIINNIINAILLVNIPNLLINRNYINSSS